MEEEVGAKEQEIAVAVAAGPAATGKTGPSRRTQKRKRRRSNESNALHKSKDEAEAGQEDGNKGGEGGGVGGGGGEGGGGGVEKRKRNRMLSISSKAVANHVMKTRVLGSESDPLNLEGMGSATAGRGTGKGGGEEGGGGGGGGDKRQCSPCALSPVFKDSGQSNVPHPQNPRDPLNLEGTLPEKNITIKSCVVRGRRGGRRSVSGTEQTTSAVGGRPEFEMWRGKGRLGRGGQGRGGGGGGGRGGRRRKSKNMDIGDEPGPISSSTEPPRFKLEDRHYCYGNYDMYYGYRCDSRGSTEINDPRISLMRREWFEGKDCLDIGCNTGQVTLAIGQHLRPRSIVGIDIDPKLIRIANKNLFRQQTPSATPDGRIFPSSFTSSSSFSLLSSKMRLPHSRAAAAASVEPHSYQSFPSNISFSQENYVPVSEVEVDAAGPRYDMIMALSVTKWVHLNWGDDGLKRMFLKMFRQLRPGGRLVLEPQPFASYSRKKKLTPTIYENYTAIKFKPKDFQSYLLSREVGFAEHKFLGVPQHKSPGFRRPLHLYVKSKTTTESRVDEKVNEMRRGGGGGGGGGGRGGGEIERGDKVAVKGSNGGVVDAMETEGAAETKTDNVTEGERVAEVEVTMEETRDDEERDAGGVLPESEVTIQETEQREKEERDGAGEQRPAVVDEGNQRDRTTSGAT